MTFPTGRGIRVLSFNRRLSTRSRTFDGIATESCPRTYMSRFQLRPQVEALRAGLVRSRWWLLVRGGDAPRRPPSQHGVPDPRTARRTIHRESIIAGAVGHPSRALACILERRLPRCPHRDGRPDLSPSTETRREELINGFRTSNPDETALGFRRGVHTSSRLAR